MTSDLWLGALLSIPIGIGTGLAVGPIERWWESHGKSKALEKSMEMRVDYAAALFFVQHPHEFTQFLLREIVRGLLGIGEILLGVLCILMPLTLRLVGSDESAGRWIAALFLLTGPVPLTMGILTLARSAKKVNRLWYRVRYFEQYQDEVLPELRKLDEGVVES